MTTIDDRAEDVPDIVLARESHGLYRLQSKELVEAEEIGEPDAFPEFGQYLAVEEITQTGKTNGEAFLECPRGLAKALVNAEIVVDVEFRVENAAKNRDGHWVFQVSPWDPSGAEANSGP